MRRLSLRPACTYPRPIPIVDLSVAGSGKSIGSSRSPPRQYVTEYSYGDPVYDGAGRLRAEDYSPCTLTQADYVAPVLSTGANYEVVYEYDNGTSGVVSKPSYASSDAHYYDESSDNLRGRLKAVHDRAATTWFKYDARGRTVTTYRKVSYVGAPQGTIANRYADHWYLKDFLKYDAADRTVQESTGAASTELLASGGTDAGKSIVKTSYTQRGTLKNVDSSYGMLVSNIKRSGDGLVQSIAFGDGAATTTAMSYDSRRRLSNVQTFRAAASLWSTAPPTITPVPGTTDATRQLLLQDLDYTYDVVNNPTEIHDWRTAADWPDTAKPVTRTLEYDDLYRLTRVDYEYPGGYDKSASPFAPEIAGSTDSRRPTPSGHKLFTKRPLWQTYKFDWLGNTTRTDDDQHAFWDRSLGDITNNTTANVATNKPYQFSAASQPTSAGSYSGSLAAASTTYDAAGNLTGMLLARSTTNCAPGIALCSSRYTYTWDEVGRLVDAKRTEGSGSTATGPTLDYLYDANDERVVKQAVQSTLVSGVAVNGPTLTTLYVFDSLEIRRAQFNATTKQYPVDSTTEVVYLAANGMRLARLDYEPTAKGEPKITATSSQLHTPNLHVLLELPDHLGSETLTIDHASGELVEARTYQPYGATESDYRPDRWKGFREDYGFTGKEEDVEVGLQYFGKRYLSPYLGRWVSADPLAVHAPGKADLNLYAYVSGQVLQNTDPVGLDTYVEPQEGSIPPPVDESGDSMAPKGDAIIGEITYTKAAPVANGDTKLLEKMTASVKAGGVQATSAVAGFKFGVAAGEVPVAGAPAAWLVSYMMGQWGPEDVKGAFGAGLAASSIPLGVQAGTEAGGALVALPTPAAPVSLGVEAHAAAVGVNAASNATAGLWLMSKSNDARGGGNVDPRPEEVVPSVRPEKADFTAEHWKEVPKGIRPQVWDIVNDLNAARGGDTTAAARLANRNPHVLQGDLAGWNSLDIVGRENPVRFLYKEVEGGYKWMLKNTH